MLLLSFLAMTIHSLAINEKDNANTPRICTEGPRQDGEFESARYKIQDTSTFKLSPHMSLCLCEWLSRYFRESSDCKLTPTKI
jgi:hypothetical protein